MADVADFLTPEQMKRYGEIRAKENKNGILSPQETAERVALVAEAKAKRLAESVAFAKKRLLDEKNAVARYAPPSPETVTRHFGADHGLTGEYRELRASDAGGMFLSDQPGGWGSSVYCGSQTNPMWIVRRKPARDTVAPAVGVRFLMRNGWRVLVHSASSTVEERTKALIRLRQELPEVEGRRWNCWPINQWTPEGRHVGSGKDAQFDLVKELPREEPQSAAPKGDTVPPEVGRFYRTRGAGDRPFVYIVAEYMILSKRMRLSEALQRQYNISRAVVVSAIEHWSPDGVCPKDHSFDLLERIEVTPKEVTAGDAPVAAGGPASQVMAAPTQTVPLGPRAEAPSVPPASQEQARPVVLREEEIEAAMLTVRDRIREIRRRGCALLDEALRLELEEKVKARLRRQTALDALDASVRGQIKK